MVRFILELDGETQHEGVRETCSSARFHLIGVHGSSLVCRLQKRRHMFQTICGMDLYPQCENYDSHDALEVTAGS